ncbi:NAD(P)-dependent dehydrogenase (short-subunit alcohol dehydrogenase family) [Nonomuraea thailandensis]|uniref:NAD(P)-dependent dehydrogenase (Short-subunit alcohol dehydrogenase family) n=1 Tax=Nonomuraea thailandensis TaxID=1188745 RepID=A0A9X2K2C5_9ACTN|nr:SDR family oxidoreductase [Nonomuraea thailandensis]MCP2356920.1 NAD(P)-dependent dehydrogenase (short-subunit alcohol dehydrogenase family) [Nonomuraea thailandensis]
MRQRLAHRPAGCSPAGSQPDRHLPGRVGTAEEIAAACAYLCSEAAGFVIGQVLGVNGGLVL